MRNRNHQDPPNIIPLQDNDIPKNYNYKYNSIKISSRKSSRFLQLIMLVCLYGMGFLHGCYYCSSSWSDPLSVPLSKDRLNEYENEYSNGLSYDRLNDLAILNNNYQGNNQDAKSSINMNQDPMQLNGQKEGGKQTSSIQKRLSNDMKKDGHDRQVIAASNLPKEEFLKLYDTGYPISGGFKSHALSSSFDESVFVFYTDSSAMPSFVKKALEERRETKNEGEEKEENHNLVLPVVPSTSASAATENCNSLHIHTIQTSPQQCFALVSNQNSHLNLHVQRWMRLPEKWQQLQLVGRGVDKLQNYSIRRFCFLVYIYYNFTFLAFL